jgi:hypothetical protein
VSQRAAERQRDPWTAETPDELAERLRRALLATERLRFRRAWSLLVWGSAVAAPLALALYLAMRG